MTDGPHIDEVRDWVGSTPDDEAIGAVLLRSDIDGDADLAALSILRRRRTDLVAAGPATFAVAGDYSQSSASNLKALDDLIARLEARTGQALTDLPTVTTGHLVRPGRGR